MNIKFMRCVDYYIGIPICFFLSCILKFTRVFIKPDKRINYKNILFIELPEMGSALLSYSAIKKIKQNFSEANLYFLIFKKNADSIKLFDILPEKNVITIDSNSFIEFLKDTVKTILFFRKIKLDLIIDFEIFSRFSVIYSYLTGTKKISGFYLHNVEGLYRGDLLDYKVTYNHYYHISQNYICLVEPIINSEQNFPKLKKPVTLDEVELPDYKFDNNIETCIKNKIKKYYTDFNDKYKIVLFSPEPGDIPIRGWKYSHYVELGKMILNDYKNVILIITGTNQYYYDNQNLCENINNNRAINLTGKTDLKEIIHLFKISDILITNDGGAGHFAGLTDIKTYIFFGPETPVMYKPLGDNINVLYLNYNCSPCLSAYNYRVSVCRDNKCVNDIKPEYVFNKIKKVFGVKKQ
jgi:ADP-heptose:LPS heptosyltransferase